jgi:signal peptidase I
MNAPIDPLLAPREPVLPVEADPSAKKAWRVGIEWFAVIAVAVVAAIGVRVLVLQQFFIAGPSMETTMVSDERVLVNKLSYRLHDVNRGDVVVFDRVTTNGGVVQHDDLIKRVIGLAGERIEVRDCVVYIDGQQLVEPYLDTAHLARPDPQSRCSVTSLAPQIVPDGHVFVMGDNRAASFDSRMFGPVREDLIVGRAFVVIWPFGNWRWL